MKQMAHMIDGYHNAVKAVLEHGTSNGADGTPHETRHLTGVNVTFDLTQFWYTSNDGAIMLPAQRGSKPTSPYYFYRELAWYSMRTRSIEPIKRYAPMWEKMADENGNVNSNYGYQLWTNNDVDGCIARLSDAAGSTTAREVLWIATEENSKLEHDTVCNNAVIVDLDVDVLELTVVARSIDLMYGLPYDCAMAQWLGQWIAERVGARLARVTFDIADMHIYAHNIDDMSVVLDDEPEMLMLHDKTPASHPGVVPTFVDYDLAVYQSFGPETDDPWVRRRLQASDIASNAKHPDVAAAHAADRSNRKTFVCDRMAGELVYYVSDDSSSNTIIELTHCVGA